MDGIWLLKELGVYSDDPKEDEEINKKLKEFLVSLGYTLPQIKRIDMKSNDYRMEICRYIKNNYPTIYQDTKSLPWAYEGKSKIRAIVLGADPSNTTYNKRFEFVFGLEKKNSQYFKGIESNLNWLGLSLDDIYVQNIIQNYFKVETSKNKQWFECALLWLEYLKRELDERFDRNIPVFVTSWEILKVLVGKEVIKKYSAHSIYVDGKVFDKNENYMGRKVICLFRHRKYELKKWSKYLVYSK